MTNRVFTKFFIMLFALATASGLSALNHAGGSNQFAGGFNPSNAPYGGFGGGNCSASRTPVIFIHGNGDEAKNWDYPSSAAASAYDTFKADGYNDCELFGITWLSSSERSLPQNNYHKASKRDMIAQFITDVMNYTGKSKVDIVSHSFGVTLALEAVDYYNSYSKVRRFISIGGGMRGLSSCYWMGYANPIAPTCGSQNAITSSIFGFHPHTWAWYNPYGAYNPRMANGGFRDYPSGASTSFYSIGADYHDQIACSTVSSYSGCGNTQKFDSRSNVKSQLDVGFGSTATQFDYDFDDWTIYNTNGGDGNGVGHFGSKVRTGAIQVNMLRTSCSGTGCCSGYPYTCGNN